MQLVAGRTGQEYNLRKKRKGALWEDRYHATAIENGDHLFRCCAYIDLNMVRAGVVDHPSQWPFSGYNEIQRPRRKKALIDYKKFMELVGTQNYEKAKQAHNSWTVELLENGYGRNDKWTGGIAVGSKEFADDVRNRLGGLALGRTVRKMNDDYQLREPTNSYTHDFEPEKCNIEPKNTYFWDINI